MSEQNGHIVSDEKLYRYFASELSKEEIAMVDSWRQESAENQNQFEEARIFYLDMKALATLEHFENASDADQSWEQFKAKQNLHPRPQASAPKPQAREVQFPAPYLRYAAAAALLLIASWFFFLQPKEIETIASNEQTELKLADGSQITLNQHASLSYPEEFSKDERRVKLVGEAYFEVSPNDKKPFIVELPEGIVRVVGTAFNIKTDDESGIKVSVTEGIVFFSSSKDEIKLTAGESALLKSNSNEIESMSSAVNVDHFWRTKRLTFDHTQLSDVVETLNQVYEADIKLSNEAAGKCPLTVNFENESLENILEVVSTTLQLEVTQNKQQYLLSGDGCQ